MLVWSAFQNDDTDETLVIAVDPAIGPDPRVILRVEVALNSHDREIRELTALRAAADLNNGTAFR